MEEQITDTEKLKAAAWDAREAYLKEDGDDNGLYANWENAEFNVQMDRKNKRIAELEAEREQLRMACGMAYCLAGKVEVDPSRPVEKMLEIIAAVEAKIDELNAWRVMFPVNTPAEIAAKLIKGG